MKQLLNKLKKDRRTYFFWKVLSYPIGLLIFFYSKLIEWTSVINIQGPGSSFKGSAIYVNWHEYLPWIIHEHGKYKRWMLTSSAPYMEPIAQWCLYSGLQLIWGAS